MYWQTKEQLRDLLSILVSKQTITGSKSEREMPLFLRHLLLKLDYFKENEHLVKTHSSEDGGCFISALVKKENTNKTLVLISHFDVVGVEDYGPQKDIAFKVDEITKYFEDNKDLLPKHVQDEISNDEWIFGRGTMDMKAGLCVQMSLLEKAANGLINGNILLIAVSDEEVGSKGMLNAIDTINKLQEEHDLEYVLCVNSEPSFKEHPLDNNKYLYTGTIGKIMPTFYCSGQETHVGEPFAGLNSSLMASVITSNLELSTEFIENIDNEQTPVITNLMLRDLKEMYNVQTPSAAVSMFNLLYMEKEMDEIISILKNNVNQSIEQIKDIYLRKSKIANVNSLSFDIKLLTWEELLEKVTNLIGEDRVKIELEKVNKENKHLDERWKSIKVVQRLVSLLPSKTPLVVMFFCPPFYPAVSSKDNDLVKYLSSFIRNKAYEEFKVEIQQKNFFPGLCDLSFASDSGKEIDLLTKNIPIFGSGYNLPIEDIKKLNFPIMNLGPYGSDPHQKTERLELLFSFETLPKLLESLTKEIFK